MSKIVWRNPCRYCITKALCRSACSDLRNNIEYNEFVFYISISILTGILDLIVIKLSFMFINPVYVWSAIGLLLLTLYSYIGWDIKKDIHGFMKMAWYEKVLILSLAPILFPAVWISSKINLDDIIVYFNYRYNEKLNPRRKVNNE